MERMAGGGVGDAHFGCAPVGDPSRDEAFGIGSVCWMIRVRLGICRGEGQDGGGVLDSSDPDHWVGVAWVWVGIANRRGEVAWCTRFA